MKRKIGYRKSRMLTTTCVIAGGIIAFLSFVFAGLIHQIFLYSGLITIGVGMLINLLYGTCPSCDHHIDVRGFGPDFCPYCGEQLD